MVTKVSRRDFMKGTAIVAVSSILFACGASGKSEYGLYETADLGGVKITFETFHALSTINPDRDVYFAPEITIENNTSDTLIIDIDTDFEAYFDEKRYPIYKGKETNSTSMVPKAIPAGEKASGLVYFEEPQGYWREFKMDIKIMGGKYRMVRFVYHNYV